MLRFFSSEPEGLEFTLSHLMRLYWPRIYRGLIRLQRQATKALFSSIDEDKDRGWMSRFIWVRTHDIIPEEKMPFLEEWNFDPIPWMPQAVPDLEDWVRKLASTSTYAERTWCDLARGRWEAKNHGLSKPNFLPTFLE
nr:uncharacterized protein LOC117275056 [Nicotiana tomentosiformis]